MNQSSGIENKFIQLNPMVKDLNETNNKLNQIATIFDENTNESLKKLKNYLIEASNDIDDFKRTLPHANKKV